MRILLAHNSLYFPSHGGGDKSNRLLMESLAAEGHEVRVMSRVERFGEGETAKLLDDLRERGVATVMAEDGIVRYTLHGVDVWTAALQPNIRALFASQITRFDPNVIITSTDDPAQLLFELAIRAPRARIVHLVRATIAVPFGPDSSAPNAAKAEVLKQADGVVGVSQYVARYVREWGKLDAIHVPISLLEPGPEPPFLGHFDNEYVVLVNPCAVKGIDIFLALADRMPDVRFAAVPTWGTNEADSAALFARSNVSVLPPVDNIDELLRVTRVMLVPSLWAEARSRMVPEAMARGVPVISSDAGGLPEAHLGVDYMLPVRLIRHYKPAVDLNMVPVAEVPKQDVDPWEAALRRLVSDEPHWTAIATQSRDAALKYAASLSVKPFESFLLDLVERPKRKALVPAMSDEKRKLLALRLKQKLSASKGSASLPGAETLAADTRVLICFPWAGGGALGYREWQDGLQGIAAVLPIRLPGRETRLAEQPFVRMEDVVPDLAAAVLAAIGTRRFAFFGHSMGAGIAFEVTRWLRARNHSLPDTLIVSGARAPQFRLGWQPGPDPSDSELIDELRRLGGLPADPDLLKIVLPVLRADTNLYRRYVYQPEEPLSLPVIAYGGADDPNVRPEHLEAWHEQTHAVFRRREFPGGHFYLIGESAVAVLEALRQDIDGAPAATV